jgi:hypothetical protein
MHSAAPAFEVRRLLTCHASARNRNTDQFICLVRDNILDGMCYAKFDGFGRAEEGFGL